MVAGDDIWLLNQEDDNFDARESFDYYNDHFQGSRFASGIAVIIRRVQMMTLTIFRGSLWYSTIISLG